MDNIRALKSILKEPLVREGIINERLAQFLAGVYEAGRLTGFEEGYKRAKAELRKLTPSEN